MLDADRPGFFKKAEQPVPQPDDPEHLSGKYHLTMLVRLLLDSRGQLVYGELVDVPSGRPGGRFAAWSDFERSVRSWVDEHGLQDKPRRGPAA
jgi:hypothetical protein